MLVNAPIAAAPKAVTTMKVSVIPSIWASSGASRTPAAQANEEPIIQASRRTLTGLVPARSSRSALSTTARMAVPVRESRKNSQSAMVAASEMPMMISWNARILVSPISKEPVGRNWSTCRRVPLLVP
jgi:hypothetical protein